MSRQELAGARTKPWLLSRSGSLAGSRFPLLEGVTRIGRAPDNDVVLEGADAAMVSLYHAEIRHEGESYHLQDLGSTNGTWLNGERVADADLALPAILQLGTQGPEFALVLAEAVSGDLDRTLEISPLPVGQPPDPPLPMAAHEELLSSAVTRARRMRAHGAGGQTMTIMRRVVEQALRRSHRRFRKIGYAMLAVLIVVTSLALWKITAMRREKQAIDAHIQQLESALQKTDGGSNADALLSQLGNYQSAAEALQRAFLYRLGGPRQPWDFLTRELHTVMAEFGAESYSIPPEFIQRVDYYIHRDEDADRPAIERALSQGAGKLATIRRILQEEHLPADLAYIPLVEGALTTANTSPAGAVGPWQFTAATAREFGLRVDSQVDQRKDLVRSTHAACKYLRELILDFGAGSSVMLALAAYNSGGPEVKHAVSRTVRDPIQQRNFWYLYRARALPLETREYVPKVFAAILIGRNPGHFGS